MSFYKNALDVLLIIFTGLFSVLGLVLGFSWVLFKYLSEKGNETAETDPYFQWYQKQIVFWPAVLIPLVILASVLASFNLSLYASVVAAFLWVPIFIYFYWTYRIIIGGRDLWVEVVGVQAEKTTMYDAYKGRFPHWFNTSRELIDGYLYYYKARMREGDMLEGSCTLSLEVIKKHVRPEKYVYKMVKRSAAQLQARVTVEYRRGQREVARTATYLDLRRINPR